MRISALVIVLSMASARQVGAQDARQGSPPSNEQELVAPVLVTRVEAEYPETAKRERREGAVGLELVVDATGGVVDANVTSPAGYGFDDAALAAARRFVFEPARDHGRAIAATVQFTYEFRLPPDAAPPPPAPNVPPPPKTAAPDPTTPVATQTGSDQSTLVLAQRPITAASAFSVRDKDFQLRPIATVADIVRVTPGILVVQHAGGGKANQYFLRGFDIDHGTDLALSIDGIPINMVSHGHGQGYADTAFIIPELIERVEVTKGPYFAEQGDFATAGSMNMVTRSDFQHSSIGFGIGGSPGRGAPLYRGLVVASPKMDRMKPMFIAEVGRTNGPFVNPERFDRYKVFNKVTFDVTPQSTLTVGGSSYAGDWNGSGQIPRREVEAGRLDRFGTHDPSEGGSSARHQLFAHYRARSSDKSELQLMTYLAQYRLDIVSNFTIHLENPDLGDQIRQRDRRTFAGGKASYRFVDELAGVKLDTTIGANLRTDSVRNALERSFQRETLANVVSARIDETSIGAFVKEEVTPVDWLRLVGGARADYFSFAVEDTSPAREPSVGNRGATQLSPKASAIVSPIRTRDVRVDLFGNYGHGFHSNDARGVTRAVDPVTPLTRAVGYEAGVRARLLDRWDLAAALWRLDLASETVWVGDAGTTEASDATKRYGVELESRFELTSWLAADVDVTATRSRFVVNRGNGDAVALAPRQTWAGGLSARHPNGLRGGFRFYGVGDRPATEDEFIEAEGFSVFDLHVGYRRRWFDVALDIENLFDAKYKAAQFATTSRLRYEPPTNAPPPPGTCGNGSRTVVGEGGNFAGCEDNLFTPGYPFTIRLMTTFFLDGGDK